ncbi:MAG: TonB-dependent receptor [Halieaceae bacterium]|jgi:outer membrane receptor protein involved in Fe transport|nr:TonB-dependent receptor [Halieaceae bacterium]
MDASNTTAGIARRPLAAALTAVLAAGTHTAIAQQQANSGLLEEIVVFAQKREQSILEVPVSVASYGSEALDRAQLRDLSELQQVAPSLVFNASTGATQSILTIRGIGTAGQNSGLEQSVGVFIDNVYRGRPGAALGDFIDLESIEVLRGPQGTLFGRNTSAGVINIRTAAPEFEFGGNLQAGIGDYGYKQLRGSLTGPLTDTVAWRLAGTWQERDGYVEDTFSGEEWNDRDRYTVRGQLLWEMNETSSLRLIADITETDERCCVPVQVFDAGSALLLLGSPTAFNPAFANFAVANPFQEGTPGSTPEQEVTFAGQYVDIDNFEGTRTTAAGADDSFEDGGISAEFKTSITDSIDMTLIGAYRYFETDPFGDIDMRSADIWRGGRGQDIDEVSLEVRFDGSSDNADWSLGAYYFDQDIEATGSFEWAEFAPHYLAQVGMARLLTDAEIIAEGGQLADILATGLVDVRDVAAGGAANPANWFPSASIAGTGSQEQVDYNATSFALFGQYTFHLSDRLSWTIGGRYSDEEKDATYQVTANDPFSARDLRQVSLSGNDGLYWALRPLQVHLALDGVGQDSFEDDDFSATTNVNYEFNDMVSVYARFAQGYKAGGLNLNGGIGQQPGNPVVAQPGPNNAFESETSESFEVGMKSFLLDNTLQLNATVFYQTTENFQTNSFDGATFTLRNAGEIEGTGLEIDYNWQPTEHWTISGGLVLQDIEYADFPTGSSTIAQQEFAGLRARALGIVPDQDLTGERPNFVSDVTWSSSVAYYRPITSGLAFNGAVNWRYRSEFTTGQDNDPLTGQDAFTTVNATIGIGNLDDQWRVELWGKNLTDETVINIGFDTPLQTGSMSAFIEPPRMYGGTVRYNF